MTRSRAINRAWLSLFPHTEQQYFNDGLARVLRGRSMCVPAQRIIAYRGPF